MRDDKIDVAYLNYRILVLDNSIARIEKKIGRH